MNSDTKIFPIPWQTILSELVGTGLLVLVGLTIVILMFGAGSPGVSMIPSEGLRRLITGFLFGTTGALIALSPVGKESGAHINPAVTFGFWMMGKADRGPLLAISSRSLQARLSDHRRSFSGDRWDGV